MNYRTSIVKIVNLACFTLLLANCGWQDNLLGTESSSSDYNLVSGNPPTTQFEVSIEKGTLLNTCAVDQQDLTIQGSMCFEVVFERAPATLTSSDFILTQPGLNATLSLIASADPLVFSVIVQNYNLNGSDDGIYSLGIPANTLVDNFGNQNLASTSSDGNVEVSQYVQIQAAEITSSGGSLADDSCQGLDLQVWSQTGLSSLNTFFSGSPGLPPASPVISGLVDNMLNDDHLEFRPSADNYVMRWVGFIEIQNAGNYRFRTRSDDGSRFYVNGARVVDNDGLHGNRTRTSSNIALTAGRHAVELQFFERTGGHNIIFTYSGPDTSGSYASPTSESLQPSNCPAITSIDKSMVNPYWVGQVGYNQALSGVVRDDSIQKHIKVGIDEDDLVQVNVGSDINGTTALSANNLSALSAHDGLSLSLINTLGSTTFGNALLTMDRSWRLECSSASDQITLQIPTSGVDSAVNSIIFSTDSNFSADVKNVLLSELSGRKAVTFRCSDFGSNIQYFTFGQYNL